MDVVLIIIFLVGNLDPVAMQLPKIYAEFD